MKKSVICMLSVLLLAGCSAEKKETPALAFKEEYESLNGKETQSGKTYRSISIPEDNPFEKISQDTLSDMLDDESTFWLYVGDSMCPWCRSVLETAVQSAEENHVEQIYYVDIWDDDHNEILRDVKKLDGSEIVTEKEGTAVYEKMLDAFDEVLEDYNLTVDDQTYYAGEKRIYAPTFFYVEEGKAVRMTTGISDLLEDPCQDLSDDILADEKQQLDAFFSGTPQA